MQSRRLTRSLATGIAVATLAAAPASAMPPMDPPVVTDPGPADASAPVIVEEGGFDWGSAGLGAAAGAGLVLAGAFATTRRGRVRIQPSS